MPSTVEIDAAEFQVWVDFTSCVTDKTKQAPGAVKEQSPVFEAVSTECRRNIQAKMNAGQYKGISSKPEHRSRKKAEKAIDATDAQLRTTYLRFPDIAKVNARVENMGLGVTVYDPIAPLYERYSKCISDKYNQAPFRHSPSERVRGWESAIKSCRRLKASLKLEAEPIMVRQPDFQDQSKRKAAIDATFNGHDEMVMKSASIEWSEPE